MDSPGMVKLFRDYLFIKKARVRCPLCLRCILAPVVSDRQLVMDIHKKFMDFQRTSYNIWIRVLISIIVVSAIRYFQTYKKVETKNWVFKGPVQKVYYDIKGFPTITVNGNNYNLFFAIWHFKTKIYIGDTVIKYKGSRRIYLIRHGTADTLFYHTREF